METQQTVIGYIRVSTDDQNNSLEVQEKQIKQYCLFKELTLITIIQDEDISGHSEFYSRPGGQKVKTLLGKCNTIVAIKPDRLFRNVKDALITVDDWNKQNIDLHIVDMGGSSFTTKTAAGRLIFTTLISFAEFERNITGERTKSVLNNRKSEGKVYSGMILGFDKTDGVLTRNEAEQEIIREIKHLSVSFKAKKIADILNEKGFRTKTNKLFHPSTVKYILDNPIYDGN